jgi:glycogen(starch) synthase
MRKLRVVYVAGGGNAFRTFAAWKDRRPDDKSSHVTYTSQVYDVCGELDASALILTTYDQGTDEQLTDGRITVERRRDLLAGTSGVRYHLAQWAFARELMEDVRRFDANVLIASNIPPLFLLHGLRRRGVAVIQALHCTLWPPHARRSLVDRANAALLGFFYPGACDGILSASEEINRQVRSVSALSGRNPPAFVDFLPHYDPGMYGGIAAPVRGADFRIMFVGRIEADKGVFNLLEIAGRLRDQGRADIKFEICGVGSALDELRQRSFAMNLDAAFLINGWCDLEQLRAVYTRCHAVIVPTTIDFIEGFNQVVVEALLAGRPVITSSACPAVEYVRDAIIEVPPDDLVQYQRAIVELADDPALYQRLRAACEPTCRKFLDPNTSYRFALRQVLLEVSQGRPISPRSLLVTAGRAT